MPKAETKEEELSLVSNIRLFDNLLSFIKKKYLKIYIFFLSLPDRLFLFDVHKKASFHMFFDYGNILRKVILF